MVITNFIIKKMKQYLTLEQKKLIKIADLKYKNLKYEETITDFVYYQFFLLKKKLQKIIKMKTYKVKKNFEIKLLDLRYYIYKKCVAYSGKVYIYKRINFDFLNSKIGSFIYTKKLGGSIHYIKKDKKKKKKKYFLKI